MRATVVVGHDDVLHPVEGGEVDLLLALATAPQRCVDTRLVLHQASVCKQLVPELLQLGGRHDLLLAVLRRGKLNLQSRVGHDPVHGGVGVQVVGEEQQHGEGGLSTSSVQSKLNQEELDLLLKPALHAHQHSDA